MHNGSTFPKGLLKVSDESCLADPGTRMPKLALLISGTPRGREKEVQDFGVLRTSKCPGCLLSWMNSSENQQEKMEANDIHDIYCSHYIMSALPTLGICISFASNLS